MKAKKAFRDLLLADAAVTALMGTRVFSKLVRSDAATRPYIVYELQDCRPERHMTEPDDLVRHEVLSLVFDDKDGRAWQVADAVRIKLDGFSGVIAGTTIDICWFLDEQDEYVNETDAAEIGAYVARQRFALWSRR